MSCHSQARIDIAGIAAMSIRKGRAQAVLVRWHGDEVDVIGHEAVAPSLRPRPDGCLAQQVDVERVVSVLKEDATAPISTLGDVVGEAGDNNPG